VAGGPDGTVRSGCRRGRLAGFGVRRVLRRHRCERQADAAESGDLGVQVVDDQVDAVVVSADGVIGGGRAPELVGPDSRSRSGPRTMSAKAGAALVFKVKPRWMV
jgi:hypothetical protein